MTRRVRGPSPLEQRSELSQMSHSTAAASAIMCAGLAITYLLLPEGGPVAIYRTAAIGAALAIGCGIFLETQGVRSLIRTDLLMLAALFGLTLVEFFFPQEAVEQMVTAQSATQGIEALFLGFCGLIIGRNFASKSRPVGASVELVQWNSATLFHVYVVIFCLGYLYMLIAVDFNPVELVNQMLAPRFSQSWQRGRLGGWSELLYEFSGLLLYLVPAIAGSILATPSRFTIAQKTIVILGLVFTLFYGFSSGTRNVFCIYLIIFLTSYISLKRHITWRRVIVLSCLAVGLLYLAAFYMLQFRTVGLERYAAGEHEAGYRKETLFVDNNLPIISQLTDVFPSRFDYLGWEVALLALLHPVPRALWPSKPEGLSISMEYALGLQGLTVSSTFVGESYMMGGYPAILLVGLLFGWLAGWWNRFGSDLRSHVSVVLYASGFFAATLSMRSLFFTTTAMLPTVAVWLYAKWHIPRMRRREVQPMSRK
jgi:oligosaccharide repeat unit polymerase